jgi:hypothetical protein
LKEEQMKQQQLEQQKQMKDGLPPSPSIEIFQQVIIRNFFVLFC